MKNIEIETKIKIEKSKFDYLENHLSDFGKHINSSNETDRYLNLKHRDFVAPEYPYEWLRIREKDGKTIFNYKHWHPKNSPVSTHCDEFETEVNDSKSLLAILNAIGVEPLVRVEKTRKKYTYQNDFEICLDYISDLGYFIEIEYIGDTNSIQEANNKIRKVIEYLELDLENKDNRGYPYLMLEKAGKI